MSRHGHKMTTLSALCAMVLTLGAVLVAWPASVSAQQAGVNPGRDCQVVRTCNFARGAEVRGCLSSYTCRTCRFVRARCTVGGRGGRCEELVCRWGG